jgi:hypothetical protein
MIGENKNDLSLFRREMGKKILPIKVVNQFDKMKRS